MAAAYSVATSRSGNEPDRFFLSRHSFLDLPRSLLCVLLLSLSASCLAVTTYAYDTSKRLVSVSYVDGTQIRYGYDAAGNIVTRVVGKVTDVVNTLDIDGSAPGSKYDALTDGLLVIRHLFGLTGTSLTAGVLGATATRTDAATVLAYFDAMGLALDIDGNGRVDALTDGLLVLRYLFGLRGAALIAGAVDAQATRKTATDIEAYLQTLMP